MKTTKLDIGRSAAPSSRYFGGVVQLAELVDSVAGKLADGACDPREGRES